MRIRPPLHLLRRPVSRCCIHSLPNRTFITTPPRYSKRNDIKFEMFDELVESGTFTSSTPDTGPTTIQPPTPTPIPKAQTPPTSELDRDTLLKFLDEGNVAGILSLPPSKLPFDAKKYFQKWSLSTIEPILTQQGQTLFSYLTSTIETPPCRLTLGKLNDFQALDFKKRWITYELDQGNPYSHLPLVEFFLQQGLKIVPPELGGSLETKFESIDGEKARQVVAKADISGSWIVKESIVEDIQKEGLKKAPDLMEPNPFLDPRDVLELPPSEHTPFHNRVIVRNHRSVFHQYGKAEEGQDDLFVEDELDEGSSTSEESALLPVSTRYFKDLQQSILMRRGVVQQTGKGKIRRIAFIVLVGDGKGLVGYGQGKHAQSSTALNAARLAAIQNMDYVARFEQRTVWTEMRTKLGATQLIIRPRPVGFGLRCNPHLHRILRAAGLKDVSAKVWGSRNKLNVIKAAFRMLHSGHAPPGMGDGLGGGGKKLVRGSGMKDKEDVERARGRKLISLRK